MTRGGTGFVLALVAASFGLAGCTLEPPRPGAEPPAGRAEIPQERTRVYVANESSNSVTVIDARTYAVLGTIDSRYHATHDLALSRDGALLLATNLASGRLSLIDTVAMETIGSVYTGERAHVVAFTNDDRRAWVANIAEDNVSILDVATRRILGTIPTGKGPTGLAFSRDGRFAYVSNQGDKTVAVVDTATHTIVKRIPVGTNPHFLILGPDGRIWGCNTGSNDIYVIDPSTQDIAGSFQVGPAPQQIAFGYKGLQGPLAYVTVAGFNKVLVLGGDSTRLQLLEEIEVGDGPNGIWANPQGTRVFVVHERSNDLRVIDTGTSRVIATVPVGQKPIRVVVSK
ncbi:MAG: beta-propeller fold lactonase family protein [Candidatus Rokuibacteriota bacterium]